MNIQALLKQAQKMQSDMAKAEKTLSEKEYVEENEFVLVKCDGEMHITCIEIKNKAYEDKEMLQDMLTVTINKVIENAKAEREQVINQITGGVKMPGAF